MNRMDKLNQLFKREVSSMLLTDVKDPRLALVTITFADISKDLSWAHIGYSVLSDDPNVIQDAHNGLSSARGRIRRLLSERVEIRYMPQLKFVYDSTIVDSFKMSKTFAEIEQLRKSAPGYRPEDDIEAEYSEEPDNNDEEKGT